MIKSYGQNFLVWNCPHCDWASSECGVSSSSLSGLQGCSLCFGSYLAETNNRLSKIYQKQSNQIRDAAECIRYELGLSESNPSHLLSAPMALQLPLITKYHEEQLDTVKQIQSQLREASLESDERCSLPQPASLRAKKTVKCAHCVSTGAQGLLSKAHIQPLFGDSLL